MARSDGLLIPPIRIKDNIHDQIRTRSASTARLQAGELQVDRLLAIDGGGVSAPVQGIETKEPAFGLDAIWIDWRDAVKQKHLAMPSPTRRPFLSPTSRKS